MSQHCDNIKSQLEEMVGKGLSDKAKLVALLEACGISDREEVERLLECKQSTLREARRALKIQRQNSSADGNPAPEIQRCAGNPAQTPEIQRQNSSASCARIETPSGLLSTSEVKTEMSEPSVSDQSDKPTPKARRRVAYTAEFQAFWMAYPSVGNSSKSEAFKEWLHLLPAEQMLAREGLKHLAEHCRKNPTYICVHACRYLSQRRWESYETPAQRLGAVQMMPTKPPEPDWLKRQRFEREILEINGEV